MEKKEFIKEKHTNIPNSDIKKKEKTGTVRINQEAIDILKLNAVIEKITMKEYLENLIYNDKEKIDENK